MVSHKSKLHIFQLMNAYTFSQGIRPRVGKMGFEKFLLSGSLLWV